VKTSARLNLSRISWRFSVRRQSRRGDPGDLSLFLFYSDRSVLPWIFVSEERARASRGRGRERRVLWFALFIWNVPATPTRLLEFIISWSTFFCLCARCYLVGPMEKSRARRASGVRAPLARAHPKRWQGRTLDAHDQPSAQICLQFEQSPRDLLSWK